MLRRDFLKRLAATAAGILVADDALELLAEPQRKLFPGADFATSGCYTIEDPYSSEGPLYVEFTFKVYQQFFVSRRDRPNEPIKILDSSCRIFPMS